MKEYLALPERSHARLAMEKEWGKANLEHFILRYKEQAFLGEQATGNWLGKNTVPCPSCMVGILVFEIVHPPPDRERNDADGGEGHCAPACHFLSGLG